MIFKIKKEKKKIDKLEKLFKKIEKDVSSCCEILSINHNWESQSTNLDYDPTISKIKILTGRVAEKTYALKSIYNIRKQLQPSGYKEYPWKFIDEKGYVILYNDKLHYRPEHRHVMECYLERPLLSTELIHHIDKNKANNSINNLQIVSSSEHGKIHKSIANCQEAYK